MRPVALLVMLLPAGPAAAGVQFQPNLSVALSAARAGTLPVMVEFTMGQGCPACVKLETEVFTRSDVARQSRRLLNVRVDASSPLAQQYGVRAFPTLVFLAPDGTEVDRVRGAPSADSFVRKIGEVAEPIEKPLLEGLTQAASGKPAVYQRALQRVALIPTEQARDKLAAVAADEEAPPAVRKTAVEGLAGQPGGAKLLVPLLLDKKLKTSATKALATAGPDGVPDLLDVLGGEDAKQRAAAFPFAQKLSGYKGGKNAKFWETGEAGARADALTAWKEWWTGRAAGAASPKTKGRKAGNTPKP